MPENPCQDNDIRMLRSHAAQLAEHFETVQIVCTRHMDSEGGTARISFGAGNWFARYGSVKEWLVQEEEGMTQRNEQDGDE